MKRYVFELIVEEGSDEFWESIAGKSGCDEVREAIQVALDAEGWQEGYGTTLRLKSFTDSARDAQ